MKINLILLTKLLKYFKSCSNVSYAFYSIILTMMPLSASASVILNVSNVDGLVGAQNVIVGGQSLNVEFVLGSCVDLFDDCDNSATDFFFQTLEEAEIASQALLDQVFLNGPLGDFDTNPGLTLGCAPTVIECLIVTPAGLSSNGNSVMTFLADNNVLESRDASRFSLPPVNVDISGFAIYARWSAGSIAVPTPPSLFLLLIGLVIIFSFSKLKIKLENSLLT